MNLRMDRGPNVFAHFVQSSDVKRWLYMPPHQSEERQKMSTELELLEAKLFMLQSKLDTRQGQAEQLKKQLNNCPDTSARQALEERLAQVTPSEADLKEIADLETSRKALLEEYWKKFFNSEWPSAGLLITAAKARENMTSPNLQLAAEKMMAFRASTGMSNSAGIVWSGNTPLSPQSEAKRAARKRPFDALGVGPGKALMFVPDHGEHGQDEDDASASIHCNCKKSRCLKLYCECFAAQKMCLDDCKCVDCANNLEHDKLRAEAIKQVLERRPDAFKTKVLVANMGNGIITKTTATSVQAFPAMDSIQPTALAHVRGCSCRKTKCTKKYCVCFNSQVKCGDWCRCTGCENGKTDSAHAESTTDKLSVLANATAAASPVQVHSN